MDAGYTAHLEAKTGYVRVYDRGAEYGQDYARWWGWMKITDELVEVQGNDFQPTREMMHAIAVCLDRAGFKEVQWWRRKRGESLLRRYPLAKWLARHAPPG